MTACLPENRVFEEHSKLSPEVEWKREDVKTFEVEITDTTARYEFSIAFRFAEGYPYKDVSVILRETTPLGEESVRKCELIVRTADGEYFGKPGYDIWDSTHLLDEKRQYHEPGVYTYTIEHAMLKDPLPLAMEIGIIVDKVVGE